MSEPTPHFNSYNLLNGMPVTDKGSNSNKLTEMPFDSSQYHHKTNLPPSNGISTSSSRSSRDSSPQSSKQNTEIGNILTQIPASQLPPSMQNRSSLNRTLGTESGALGGQRQPKNILLNQTMEHASQNILLASAVNAPSLVTNSQFASKVQLIGTSSSTVSSSPSHTSSTIHTSSSPLVSNNVGSTSYNNSKLQTSATLPPRSSPVLNLTSSATVKTSLEQNNRDLGYSSSRTQEQFVSSQPSTVSDTESTLSGNNQQNSEQFNNNHSLNISTSQNSSFMHSFPSQSRSNLLTDSYISTNVSAPSNVPTAKSISNVDTNLQNKNVGDSVTSKVLDSSVSMSTSNFDVSLLKESRTDLFSNIPVENKMSLPNKADQIQTTGSSLFSFNDSNINKAMESENLLEKTKEHPVFSTDNSSNSKQMANQQYSQSATFPTTQQVSTSIHTFAPNMNVVNKQGLNMNEMKQAPINIVQQGSSQFPSKPPLPQDNQKQEPVLSLQNNATVNQTSTNLLSKGTNYLPTQASSVSPNTNYRPQYTSVPPNMQQPTPNYSQMSPKISQSMTYPTNQQPFDSSNPNYKNNALQATLPPFSNRQGSVLTPPNSASSSPYQNKITPPVSQTSYVQSPIPNKNMPQMVQQNFSPNMPPPPPNSQGYMNYTPLSAPNPPSTQSSSVGRRYPAQLGYQQQPTNQMQPPIANQQFLMQNQYSANQQNVNYQSPPTQPPQYIPTNQQPKQHIGVSRPPVNQYQQTNYQNLNQDFGNLNITQTGFSRLWGAENFDLLQVRNILPLEKVEAPQIRLQPESLDPANCHPDIFRCTMTKIPENNSLLNKSRLPLGVLIHPFRDLNHLPVIQCSTIVRCRACRTYINPFVYFVDQKRWKCNLCYRVNELPEEFQYDPVSKSYGDPSRRPEIKSSTIEYIAPSEYMLRPPQPAVYLFLLDISSLAVESGYLKILCDILTEELDNLPGDARTQIGFLCYNSAIHFYSLGEGLSQPHEMTVVDIDDIFLPSPDNLLVNLKERKELIKDLLAQLPTRFMNSHDNNSALGAALQAALKMMSSTGGRVSVFQCTLPTVGPGSLTSREIPANRANADVQYLNPSTDFYKRLALDCSAHQVAVDLFILNSHYIDLSTISGISRFSAGCIHHWPLFKASRTLQVQQFENCLRRYLTRKIGYEAVMRIRCTRGLAIHTFHGNFFVRSTDLLSLPNCNPDAGFGMQVAIEECLSDLQTVCFQAALLYTSSKGERRIRVHTLCLPIANTLTDVLNSADQQCIVGLVAKMAVDRSFQSSLSDARDAFINVVIDILSAYKLSLNQGASANSALLAPASLKLLPLYIVALLKYIAFQTGTNIRLDDRVFAMCQMKTLPLQQLIQEIYPDLYPIHCLTDQGGFQTEDGHVIPQPPRLQLSAEKLDSRGAFLLDHGHHMMIYVGHLVSNEFLNNVLGYPHFAAIPDDCFELPKTRSPDNERLHLFISSLNDEKPYPATIQIIRDNSPVKKLFVEKLIEDRVETALSYYEFLQHLKAQVK